MSSADASGDRGAAAHRRLWHRLRSLGLLLLGQADALARVAARARDRTAAAGDANRGQRRVGHEVRNARRGERVRTLPVGQSASAVAGTVNIATAGAATIAMARPPAAMSRRAESWEMAMSLVLFLRGSNYFARSRLAVA